MTIASEIERLQDVRTDIYDELGNKCVNLDDSSKYADVAPIIKKMPVVCAKIGANKYPVVKIGNQLWTAKNLDEPLGTLGTNEWYYNNDEATYKKYGRLYTWDNVNTNLASLGLQGWRMPTKADFDALVETCGGSSVAGKNIKSSYDWDGSDSVGFNVLHAGCWEASLNKFANQEGEKLVGYVWSTSLSISGGSAYRFKLLSTIDKIDIAYLYKNYGISVRLVCDLNEDGSIPDGAVIIAEADESVATLSEDGVAVTSVEPSTDSES